MSTMHSTPSPRFGLEPQVWRRHGQAVVAELLGSPVLRWLVPVATVLVRTADGAERAARLAHGQLRPAAADHPTAHALPVLEMPAERVLLRSLPMPAMASSDLAQAVQFDVAASSPFPPEQTVHGHSVRALDAQRVQVDIAITSRTQVQDTLRQASFNPSEPPEVWALPAPHGDQALRPIVLRGFGELARQRQTRRGLNQRLLMTSLLLLLLLALLATPVAFQQSRARQAQQSFAELQQRAAPQLKQREVMVAKIQQLQVVGQSFQQQLAIPPALSLLSQALPDGAWLMGLRVEGDKLVLNGLTDDAAALVQRLSSQAGVHDVRLASPATRGFGATQETFIIELKLDGRRYGRTLGGAAGTVQ